MEADPMPHTVFSASEHTNKRRTVHYEKDTT